MADAHKYDAMSHLKTWFARDFRYANWDRDVELVEFAADGTVRIRIYTEVHCYAISARPHTADKKSYLGCIASTRKPRAGEDWNRGNDHADGPLDEKTWRRILADIVSYEMVKVHHVEPRDPAWCGQPVEPPQAGPPIEFPPIPTEASGRDENPLG